MKYNDNPILIDVNSRKRNKIQPMFCVLCSNDKVQLECFNSEENRYRCPRCKNSYQVGFELLPTEEDILESSHELDDEDSIGLLVAEDEFKREYNDSSSKSDIPVPKYMKVSETSKVIYYRED